MMLLCSEEVPDFVAQPRDWKEEVRCPLEYLDAVASIVPGGLHLSWFPLGIPAVKIWRLSVQERVNSAGLGYYSNAAYS